METTRISIDFGTSHTVAVLSGPGREPRALLFDGSPLLLSAVYAMPDGRLVVGRDAWHAGSSNPAGLEPYPKRHIDEDRLLLDGQEVTLEAVVAAVLRHVSVEADRAAGDHVATAVLTCPASWGGTRRGRLEAAAGTVFSTVHLVAEPVAAARHHLSRTPLTDPGYVLVYDLGAGTFDASLVRCTPDGIELVTSTGLDDAGGLDIDAAIVDHLGQTLAARDPDRWRRLAHPGDRADRRARRLLWDAVRTAKEVLSRTATTIVHIPLFDEEMPLGRERLEELARPVLDRTVAVCRDLSTAARSGPLLGVFLVGGASRMPLVGTLLHQALGVAPAAVDQPELAVAEGALADPPAATDAWPPADMPPAAGTPAPHPRRRRWVAAGAVTVVAAATAVWLGTRGGSPPADGAQRSPTPVASEAGSTPTPSPTPSPLIDPCLVGVWDSTSYSITNFIDGVPTTFTNTGGTVKTVRADGTYVHDYNSSPPRTATFNGNKWEQRIRGTFTGRLRTHDQTIIYSGTARGTSEFFENGSSRGRQALTLDPKPSTYLCDGDTWTEYTQDWRIDYNRRPTG
ncbi:Hsp70 family protein [Phytohabitans rumicis]|uniref:Molecular chaperone DnaK n=1 Tax=Phytohabitans rumicis TaxID=1076125 RepID=A0A6V8KYL8_9ACTN|nr:Hsp70 family protein [Phytohabitans rumicis]GFJ86937.1 hypothetical protein Prum_005790 [Phytohabitans rumicis]